MSGHQVTMKSEKLSGKMVYFEDAVEITHNFAVCYNVDATASTSDPIPSTYRVEKPSATNLEHFAGVISDEFIGRTGPCQVRVYEPDKMQKVNAYIGINTVADTTLLCLTPAQYYLGGVGASAVVVARAIETDATLTGTPGNGFVKLNPSANDAAGRRKVGAEAAYLSAGATATGVKFWEFRTKSEDSAGSDCRGLYWWHQLAGTTPSGEAGRFMTVGMSPAIAAIHGMHNSISISGATATITGLGAANRATVMVPNQDIGTGGVYGVMSEWYAEGDASAKAAGYGSFFRACLDGDGTGKTALNGKLALMDLDGITIGAAAAGNVVDALAGDVAATHVAHIRINGANYYILLRNAVT